MGIVDRMILLFSPNTYTNDLYYFDNLDSVVGALTTVAPTEAPTAYPSQWPTYSPIHNPTATPTTQPTPCLDIPTDKFYYKMKKEKPIYKSCKWLANKSHKGIGPAKDICKVLCGTCPTEV